MPSPWVWGLLQEEWVRGPDPLSQPRHPPPPTQLLDLPRILPASRNTSRKRTGDTVTPLPGICGGEVLRRTPQLTPSGTAQAPGLAICVQTHFQRTSESHCDLVVQTHRAPRIMGSCLAWHRAHICFWPQILAEPRPRASGGLGARHCPPGLMCWVQSTSKEPSRK